MERRNLLGDDPLAPIRNPGIPSNNVSGTVERETAGELFRPESSGVDIAIACAIAAFTIWWVKPFFSYVRFDIDEGITLQGAVRILGGELPYRDFFAFYTPGSYYLYAALFRLLGISLPIARALLVAYATLFSLVTYLLVRRTSSRSAGTWVACILSAICVPTRFAVSHSWDSTAMALLSLYCAVWFLQTSSSRWAFISGAFSGATLMTEQSKGAGLLLGFLIAAVAIRRIGYMPLQRRHFLWFILGGLVPVSLVIAYFGIHGSLADMVSGWLWPLRQYREVNDLPYGYFFWSSGFREAFASFNAVQRAVEFVMVAGLVVIVLLPIMVIGFTVIVGLRVALREIQPRLLSDFALLSGSIVFGVFLSNLATGRADYLRINSNAPLFFHLMPLLLDRRLVKLPAFSKLQPFMLLWLFCSFLLYASLIRISPSAANNVVHTRRGTIRTATKDEVLPYLQQYLIPGQKMLVYPYMPLYSFLSATSNPTRFDYLQVGLHTPSEFETAREELEQDKTPVVLFDLTFRNSVTDPWPATPARLLGADPTGDFIFQHYQPCKIVHGGSPRFSAFAYMVRKDLHCP